MKLYVLTDGKFYGAFTTREKAHEAMRDAIKADPYRADLDIVEIDADTLIEDFDSMPAIWEQPSTPTA